MRPKENSYEGPHISLYLVLEIWQDTTTLSPSLDLGGFWGKFWGYNMEKICPGRIPLICMFLFGGYNGGAHWSNRSRLPCTDGSAHYPWRLYAGVQVKLKMFLEKHGSAALRKPFCIQMWSCGITIFGIVVHIYVFLVWTGIGRREKKLATRLSNYYSLCVRKLIVVQQLMDTGYYHLVLGEACVKLCKISWQKRSLGHLFTPDIWYGHIRCLAGMGGHHIVDMAKCPSWNPR